MSKDDGSFEEFFRKADPIQVVYVHQDGRALIRLGNGSIRLPAEAFKALCKAGLLVKEPFGYNAIVDIYVPPKPNPVAQALLGDDPFEGL